MALSEHEIDSTLIHDRFVRALARGLVADAATADDVAQEAWLAALRGRVTGLATFPRWLSGTVRNLADRARRRAEREEIAARSELVPSAAEVLERESLRARIVAAVLALDEPYRATLLLRYFEGLAPRAVARRQGVPVETVRTRTKRALERLRRDLEHEFGPRSSSWAWMLALARAPRPTTIGPLAESLPLLTKLAVMSTQAKVAGAAAGALLIALLFVAQRGSRASSAVEEPARPAPVALVAPPAEVPREPESPATAGASDARAPVAAEPAPAASVANGSLRVRVTWFDGSPAEGIHVFVNANWSEGGYALRSREGLTDAQGEVRVDELAPGSALAQLDRGPFEEVEIAAGQEATLELMIPRGFDVTGIVRGPTSAPVADADVWASKDLQIEQVFVVARSDGAGRFLARSLARGYIGARAAGFAPSLCQSMLAGEGAALEIELVLMGPGGAISGTVLDPDGQPLAGAWVGAGLDHPLGQVHMTPVGGEKEVKGLLPGPIATRTDADGRFRITGLAPGTRRMAARAPGFGAWRGEVEVVEHARRTQDIRLQLGVSLVGRVTLADGATPARASIEIGEFFSVLRSSVDTDGDGRFRLDGLEAGEFEVHATTARSGKASAKLRGAPGETITWEPRLTKGGSIRGRLLDASGAPLAGWQIQTQDEPSVHDEPDFTAAASDAQGRFVLEDLHERTHRVDVRPPEGSTFPVAQAKGVIPEREELVLRIADDALPSVVLTGRVVDESGQAVDDAQLVLSRGTERGLLFTPQPTGAFEIGPLPPGTWTLKVRSPALADCPDVVLGPRELAPDESWDCGTIVLARGGTLLVAALGPGLAAGAEPDFVVLREGGLPDTLRREGGFWRSNPLASGSYRLQVRGRLVAAMQLPFAIRAGEVTRIEVPLGAGIGVPIRVQAAANEMGPDPRVRISAADGALVLEQEIWLREDAEGFVHPGDYGTEVALAPGHYRVEAWLENGPRAEAELRVKAGVSEAEPLVLDLR